MSTALHSCIEASHGYCDALEDAFVREDAAAFREWLELQRNWLLVALRESFALEHNDGCEEMSEPDVIRLLAESDARRKATVTA